MMSMYSRIETFKTEWLMDEKKSEDVKSAPAQPCAEVVALAQDSLQEGLGGRGIGPSGFID